MQGRSSLYAADYAYLFQQRNNPLSERLSAALSLIEKHLIVDDTGKA